MRNYNRKELYPNTKMLSSSQLIDYIKDPQAFYHTWVVGMEKKMGMAGQFGTAFSELYADRNFNYREFLKDAKVPKRLLELMGNVIKFFPLPKNAEYELKVPFKGWKFRITLDDFSEKLETIIENKTSAYLYTDLTVRTNFQFTLQQWGYWKKYGKLPKKHLINVVDTSAGATKLLQTFICKRTEKEMIFVEEIISLAIRNLEAENFSNYFMHEYAGQQF